MSTQKHVTDEQLLYFGQQVAGKEKELRDAEVVKLVAKEDGKSLISAEDLAQITTNKTNIETLVGEDTGKSARAISAEELAKQLIPENAKESLDTLTEIAAWIQQHPDDASAMNLSIENLAKLVGTLPESTTATDVVGYAASLNSRTKTSLDNINVGLGLYALSDCTLSTYDFDPFNQIFVDGIVGYSDWGDDSSSRVYVYVYSSSSLSDLDFTVHNGDTTSTLTLKQGIYELYYERLLVEYPTFIYGWKFKSLTPVIDRTTLIEQILTHKDAITTLNADSTTAGSVDYKIAQAIADIPTAENVDAKIQVETDRATAAEQANADAITALNGDDTVECSVAYKIKEATKDLAKFSDVSTMLTEQYNGLNSKINDNMSRLDTLEADMSTPGSVDYKINAALESMSIETATNEDIDNIIATIYGTTEQGA